MASTEPTDTTLDENLGNAPATDVDEAAQMQRGSGPADPVADVIPSGGSTLPVSEEELQEWDPMPDELIEGGLVEPDEDPMTGGAPTG